jgi:membrane protease YdiL (CAAX protease family)
VDPSGTGEPTAASADVPDARTGSTDEVQVSRVTHLESDPAPRRAAMSGRTRLLIVAVAGEGALALGALAWIRASGHPLRPGPLVPGLAIGVETAVALAGVQYWLLRVAPDRGFVRSLRELYRRALRPLFAQVGLLDIVIISVCAGIGEELLFRGAVQQSWGWTVASVSFGLCHVGGRSTWPLGVWAAGVGGLLGWLATATGGLLASIVAHALYDALALSYIRWGRPV